MDIRQLINTINPEIYGNLKTAVELGKWPDGIKLTANQKESCLQAIIAYDISHNAESLRIGSIAATTTCGSYKSSGEVKIDLDPEPIKLPSH